MENSGRVGAGRKKTFVLDTSVMLHDYNCLYNFEENDVVVPIMALEELDHFKKGNEALNYNAREFARSLDALSGDALFGNGISLGAGKGLLRVVTGKPFSETMRESFRDDINDHRILAIASYLHEHEAQPVILVSKDINLRMKAKSIGVAAEDYLNDKVESVSMLERAATEVEGVDASLLSKLYGEKEGIRPEEISIRAAANECFLLRGAGTSAMARYDSERGVLVGVDKQRCYGVEPRNAEQTFALSLLTDARIPLVALTGKAGTGKTLLALAAALAQQELYSQILLARPIVALSNKDVGFLPGDIDAKIGPYMLPLFDNLAVIKSLLKSTSRDYIRIDELQRQEKLVISPLAYIRGRSLSNTFMIVDEAQNLTPHEVKTIITRAADGTKIVFTGDVYQIDHPYLDSCSNGLSYLCGKMHGQPLFAHVNLVKGERSKLSELASRLL